MGNTSVFGIYPDRAAAAEATEALQNAGWRSSDISVLAPENRGSKDFGHVKGNKGPEGAAAGAAAGAVTGGVIGWRVSSGTVFLPGLESLAGVAPTVAALAAAGGGGAIGWLIGLYLGLGVPEYLAQRYMGRMRRAGILLSVHCDNSQWTRRARQILRDTGAQSIASATELDADFVVAERPASRVIRIS